MVVVNAAETLFCQSSTAPQSNFKSGHARRVFTYVSFVTLTKWSARAHECSKSILNRSTAFLDAALDPWLVKLLQYTEPELFQQF